MHLPPKFLQNLLPIFSLVHLLRRLCGVDTPGPKDISVAASRTRRNVPACSYTSLV